MKFNPVKIGVIGCGMISSTYMTNLTKSFSITNLVAAADLVDSKVTQRCEQFGLKKMSDEELLADPEIEIVANLTYASAHYEVSKMILEAGKHCYSEKMLADNMDEADELYALAKSKGLMLACAPDTFLGASMQTARYIVDKGLIGKPVMGAISLGRNYQLIKSDADDAVRRYSVVRRGGGIPYDMGGYYLHTLFSIFGPVKRVFGVADTYEPDRPYLNPRHSSFNENFFMDTENRIAGVLEFENGFLCTIAINSDAPAGSHSFHIDGTEGTLYIADPNNFGDMNYIRRAGIDKVEFPSPFPNEWSRGVGIADMAWALRTGRPPRLSAEMSCHTLEVVKGILESGRTGRAVETKYRFERPAPLLTGLYKNGVAERSIYFYDDGKNIVD